MKVDKMSISVEPNLGDAIRESAAREGKGLSAWIAEAARARLRTEALGDFLQAWVEEHGELTEADIANAEAELDGKTAQAS